MTRQIYHRSLALFTHLNVIAIVVFAVVITGAGCGSPAEPVANNNSAVVAEPPPQLVVETPDEPLPSDEAIEELIKETTSKFSDAVSSGDFSELYESASADFQKTLTLDELKNSFSTFVEKKATVLPILKRTSTAKINFEPAPSVTKERGVNFLNTAGKFQTTPNTVTFDFGYIKRGDDWKLLKLKINIP